MGRTITAASVAALGVAMALLPQAGAVAAAAPGNDTIGGATAIGALPFDAVQDTTGATSDSTDIDANARCGAPALDASVWYSITADSDQGVVVDATASDYSVGVIVVSGEPGSFVLENCGPEQVGFVASAGTTYRLMFFDDQNDGTGVGGKLTATVSVAPPPPTVDLVVDPTARFDVATGAATVTGTISCDQPTWFGRIKGSLVQQVGRGQVRGGFGLDVVCDGVPRKWQAVVSPFAGSRFAGGKAATVTFAVACGMVFCGLDYDERVVQLSRR